MGRLWELKQPDGKPALATKPPLIVYRMVPYSVEEETKRIICDKAPPRSALVEPLKARGSSCIVMLLFLVSGGCPPSTLLCICSIVSIVVHCSIHCSIVICVDI